MPGLHEWTLTVLFQEKSSEALTIRSFSRAVTPSSSFFVLLNDSSFLQISSLRVSRFIKIQILRNLLLSFSTWHAFSLFYLIFNYFLAFIDFQQAWTNFMMSNNGIHWTHAKEIKELVEPLHKIIFQNSSLLQVFTQSLTFIFKILFSNFRIFKKKILKFVWFSSLLELEFKILYDLLFFLKKKSFMHAIFFFKSNLDFVEPLGVFAAICHSNECLAFGILF